MLPGEVRIIGGKWRGRKLKVLQGESLRPTPDRVRETLFNWLAPVISGAYCLDLFAGSGILGVEALSRGAKQVIFMDRLRSITDLLKVELHNLGASPSEARVECGSFPQQLPIADQPYDIVFLDPPYQANLLIASCVALEQEACLAKNAYIYLESNAQIDREALPQRWRIIKQKKAGQVHYHLALRN